MPANARKQVGELIVTIVVIVVVALMLIGGAGDAQRCADSGGHYQAGRGGDVSECVYP